MPDESSSRPPKTARPPRGPKKLLAGVLERASRTGSIARKLAPRLAPPNEIAATLKKRRVARRSTSGVALTLADDIDALNPALWDQLASQTVFLQRDYLRVMQTHAPRNLVPRYVIATSAAEDGGAARPLAILLFQRLAVAGDRLRPPGTTRGLLKRTLDGLEEHLLVCGNVLVWGPRAVAFAPDADRELLWRAVGEALYRLRRADKLLGESDFALIKDFAGDDADAAPALRLLGYRSVQTEPDMVLALRPGWKSFDDYLASMTSSYRSTAKKLLKDCATAGVVLRDADAAEMQRRQDELHALYMQVHEAQGLRLATLAPGYLPALAAALGTRFACKVAERDGRLLGFVTNVADGDTAVGYYVGYDRAANADAPIYLALLQSTVETAIGFGARRLSLGRTALEPKARMGCTPQPLACGVRHRVSALNWITSALTRTASHDEPPARSPFKAS